MNTRVVAPLIAQGTSRETERLMPAVSVQGSKLAIDVSNLGTFAVKAASPPVANLESERYRLVAAIDLVFTGI